MNGWVAVFLFTEKGKNGKLETFFTSDICSDKTSIQAGFSE